MKHLKKFNESIEYFALKNALLKCGFKIIKETDIPNYFDDGDDLKSFKNENIYEFGYLTEDEYCLIKLDINNDDAVLSYKDGSSNFIIRYDNILYLGYYSEGLYLININDYYGSNSDVFDDFKKDMISNNISIYYCVNF